MGTPQSREKRRGGENVQRGRARVCEFRVGELVTLKNAGTGVYHIVEAEGRRVKLCNINDPLLAAWMDVEHVEPYSANESAGVTLGKIGPNSSKAALPAKRPQISPSDMPCHRQIFGKLIRQDIE